MSVESTQMDFWVRFNDLIGDILIVLKRTGLISVTKDVCKIPEEN